MPHKPTNHLSPKERFLALDAPKGQPTPPNRWADLTGDPLFAQACEVALLEYVMGITPEPTMPGTAAYRVQGAKEVLNVLLTLHAPAKPLPVVDTRKLTMT